ncbi:hypothetical protein [Leisingera aquaemixtae]|uniref:hypothetical protein n=1 Tax=Leisingera aquaemixtae TaxID=1396826 RepID=UPI0028F749B3|nr:hypothetical protein [Leisingera aquaemixtae]
MDQTSSKPQQVRRRRVFYIPGYDPIHPRRYRELYRKEGAAQAKISGYSLTLSPKRTKGPYGWHAAAEMDGQRTGVDIEVLVWSDIVRGSMEATIPGTYWQLLRTAWIYISTGALRRLMRLRKGPVIAALYPVGMLLLQALLALLLAWGVANVFAILDALASLGGPLAALIGWAAGLGAGYALLRWFKKRDGKFFAYYLMHDYAHSAASRGAIPPDMEARMRQFRSLIREALDDQGLDEVLVVGHSSGAHLGVSVLADLLRNGLPPERPALGFLTLGQVVPMVSFLPKAKRLRTDLKYLSQSYEITWIDVTAPGDGCAFALCDPVAVSGVAPEGKRWPLVFSAAFTQTLSPERWQQLRWRFFRLHFQYLCAFDRPGDYDYFRITAGPLTLAERYRDRKPSQSRIDVPVSKFTSVAAE